MYLSTQGGFNDMLCNIQNTIDYCIKTNRALLVDTTKCCYGINFSDYFYFKDMSISIITDVNDIRKIIADDTLTIYPNIVTDRNLDNWEFKWKNACIYTLNGEYMELPVEECHDAIIVHSTCGGGPGINLFKNLFFSQSVIDYVKRLFAELPEKYLAIQIRNTDISCNYKLLYEENMSLIHSYDTLYIATDDPESLMFFRAQGLNVLNFTEFPLVPKRNLHISDVSGDTKIKNVICDMYIISVADEFLSNSEGGFINLIRDIRNDVSVITDKIV